MAKRKAKHQPKTVGLSKGQLCPRCKGEVDRVLRALPPSHIIMVKHRWIADDCIIEGNNEQNTRTQV